MTPREKLELAQQLKIILAVAPKRELYVTLDGLAKNLKDVRVLGILGEDVRAEDTRDVSLERPVLIGIPGERLLDIEPRRSELEQLASKHGSWEVGLLSRFDAPRSLGSWLQEMDALVRFEALSEQARQGNSLLEYVQQAPRPYQPKLIWVERRGRLITALGLQEAAVGLQGQVVFGCRESGVSKEQNWPDQTIGVEKAENALLEAFDEQLHIRKQAERGVLNPYCRNRNGPDYSELLGQKCFVPLPAHRPGQRAYGVMSARLLLFS